MLSIVPAYHSKTTSGDFITDDWAYPVPSGASLFTPNGYAALLVTANDTARPDLRPRSLDQNDLASGSDTEWAKIGKYSIAGGGPYRLAVQRDLGLRPQQEDAVGA